MPLLFPRRRFLKAAGLIAAPAILGGGRRLLGTPVAGMPASVIIPGAGDSNFFSGITVGGATGYDPAIDITNNFCLEYANAPNAAAKQFIRVAKDQFGYNADGSDGSPSLSANAVVNSGGIGPGLTFMRDGALGILNPTGFCLMIVAQAVGGQGLGTGGVGYWGVNKSPFNQGGLSILTRRVNAALALNPSNTLGPLLWVTGANDAIAGMSAPNYTTEFQASIANLRANITGGTNMIVLVSCLPPLWVASNPGTFGGVDAALAAMPTNVSKCGYVDPTAPGLSGNIVGQTAVPYHLANTANRLTGNPGFMNAYNSRSA